MDPGAQPRRRAAACPAPSFARAASRSQCSSTCATPFPDVSRRRPGPGSRPSSQVAMSVSADRDHARQRRERRVLGCAGIGRPSEHGHAVREGDELRWRLVGPPASAPAMSERSRADPATGRRDLGIAGDRRAVPIGHRARATSGSSWTRRPACGQRRRRSSNPLPCWRRVARGLDDDVLATCRPCTGRRPFRSTSRRAVTDAECAVGHEARRSADGETAPELIERRALTHGDVVGGLERPARGAVAPRPGVPVRYPERVPDDGMPARRRRPGSVRASSQSGAASRARLDS